MFKYYFIINFGGGFMNINEYFEKVKEHRNEVENIRVFQEKNQRVLNWIESYEINKNHILNGDYGGLYTDIHIDTDLLVNALEQQKEKNEARLNEIKEEISKLQKEDIQL